MPRPDKTDELTKTLKEKILILDGAMGTTIRSYGLREKDARGKQFADAPRRLLRVLF